MPEHLKKFEFQKGMGKIGGRQKGTRNKLSEAFIRDLHDEWERSGPAVLRILAVENPAALAAIVAKTIPQAFDADAPAVLHIVTGVPRHGEVYPIGPPKVPGAIPLPSPAHEGDDAE
jgi:hypothetical protein